MLTKEQEEMLKNRIELLKRTRLKRYSFDSRDQIVIGQLPEQEQKEEAARRAVAIARDELS